MSSAFALPVLAVQSESIFNTLTNKHANYCNPPTYTRARVKNEFIPKHNVGDTLVVVMVTVTKTIVATCRCTCNSTSRTKRCNNKDFFIISKSGITIMAQK